MEFVKKIISCIIGFAVLNFVLWGAQELYYYKDTKEIKNIEQALDGQKNQIIDFRETIKIKEEEVENLVAKMEYWKEMEMIENYNSNVDICNKKFEEYNNNLSNFNDLISNYNVEVERLNELIKKSGSRWYIIPLPGGNGTARAKL